MTKLQYGTNPKFDMYVLIVHRSIKETQTKVQKHAGETRKVQKHAGETRKV